MLVGMILTGSEISAAVLLENGIESLARKIAPKKSDTKDVVAILPFVTLDGEASHFGKHIAEQLLTELYELKKLQIVTRAHIDQIMSEMKLGATGLLEDNTVKKLGKILGADLIGTGTYTNMGKTIELNARLIKTETGVVIGAGRVKIKVDNSVRNLLQMEDSSEIGEAATFGQKIKSGKEKIDKLFPGTYAIVETTLGEITCILFEDKAPKTVANFITLAEGRPNPRSEGTEGRKFYDGLKFHRVIPEFMIQGGDPDGKGTGGPGYRFEDEIDKSLTFDRPGRLAMANAGPNTNGSQFFITVNGTSWLDGKHTIFGQVVKGQDIVEKISQVERNSYDRPVAPIYINKVIIKYPKGSRRN